MKRILTGSASWMGLAVLAALTSGTGAGLARLPGIAGAARPQPQGGFKNKIRTEADYERIAAAQAKRDRKAERRRAIAEKQKAA